MEVSRKQGNPPGTKFFPLDLPESVAILAPQADAIRIYFDQLPEALRDERVYIEARIRPNFLSASNHPRALLSAIDAVQVGTRADSAKYVTKGNPPETAVTKRLILSVPMRGIKLLPGLLRQTVSHSNQGQASEDLEQDIKKIELLTLPLPEGSDANAGDLGQLMTFEAVLNPEARSPSDRSATSQDVLDKFSQYVSSFLGGEVVMDYARTVGDLTFVPVRLVGALSPDAFRFNPLRSLRPMPVLSDPPTFGVRSLIRAAPPASMNARNTKFTVGVFDGGIGRAQIGSSYFPSADVDLTDTAETSAMTAHGTAVVGAAMYGLLDQDDQAPDPVLPVESYRILPPRTIPNDLYCFWALDQIKAVIANGQHDIYNLSLGPDSPVTDRLAPNRWTCELDDLAWKHQSLLVVAAGNGGQAPVGTQAHRVQIPGDMVNAVTVGACDAPAPEKLRRSPESSYGPGRYGARVQPTVVQYGGTASALMHVLTADGGLRKDAGTSFAAPLVTHALSGLVDRLGSADPSTLRAFAVHFAERPRPQRLITEVGHGRAPLSFNSALACGPDEVHVLYRDRISRTQDLSYEIPTPDGFTGPLRVRITLAFASPIDASDALEYTQASLAFTLRPDSLAHTFSKKGSMSKHITRLGTPEAKRLRAAGWHPSKHPNSQTTEPNGDKNKGERWLRRQGKWETIRLHEFTLAADSYFEPRLHMNYLARSSGALTENAPLIPFAAIVTVRDPGKSGQLYDRVENRYPMLVGVSPLSSRLQP